MKIDLNCDLGESFGAYTLGSDAAIMPYVTSVNIACGFHAGDPSVMQTTLRLAKQHGLAIGAHPGWPDLQGFGRREMKIAPPEAEALVLYQIGALAAFARAEGVELRHVKPHGALYNQAAKDMALAEAVARAVKRFSVDLVLIGLAGCGLLDAGRAIGLKVADEAFPDRAYNPDGSLMPRHLPGAVLENPAEIAANAVRLTREGIRFEERVIRPDTLCLHGDHPGAVENARRVREALCA
ncbi:MAG: 5-oxoprolinase subunit PxpA [Anaerolineales bacterium]|nr:5-oxoprolinase subunit PxpA [Anaerolineales bacterium]